MKFKVELAIFLTILIAIAGVLVLNQNTSITGAVVSTLPIEESMVDSNTSVENDTGYPVEQDSSIIINETIEETEKIETEPIIAEEKDSSLGIQDIGIQAIPAITLVLNTTNVSRNDTDVNLTAYNTTQTNGTSLKVIYNWLRNSTPIAALNMPFEGINGTTTNNSWDYSGYGYHGKDNGDVTWRATGGFDGKGHYAFDGVNDYIEVATGSNFSSLCVQGCTFMAWANKTNDGTDGVIVGRQDLTDENRFFEFMLDDEELLRLTIFQNGSSGLLCEGQSTVGSFGINRWSHFVGIYNLTNIAMYVNGSLLNTTACNFSSVNETSWRDPETTFIGIEDDSGLFSDFTGTIDEVMIFNRSLSTEQVFAFWQSQTNVITPPETEVRDVWSVQATPNNGTGDGNMVTSDTVTILTSEPIISSLTLNTTNISSNDTNVNLTAYAETITYGAKVIYNWLVNATSIAILNMPFEGGSLEGNNTGGKDGTRNYARIFNGSVVNATWNATGGYDGKGAYEFHGRDLIMTGLNTFGGAAYATLSNLTNFTLTAWVKPSDDVSKSNVIVGTTGSGSGFSWRILRPTNRTDLAIGGSTPGTNYCISTSGAAINHSIWTHVAVSWDNFTGCSFYLNGKLINNQTTTVGQVQWGAGATGSFIIGARRSTSPNTNSDAFNGTIDEVIIFNRTLSAEQIFALWQNKTNVIVANETTTGENWTVEVTPNNGTEDGLTVTSNNVTILGNFKPVIISLLLNTTNLSSNRTEVNLTAYTTTSDADDDSVKVIYNWLRNGTSIAVLNMPFEGINGTVTNNAWDYSGYGSNGTKGTGVTWNATGGYDEKGAYMFDGGSSATITLSRPQNIDGEFSLAGWVYPTINGFSFHWVSNSQQSNRIWVGAAGTSINIRINGTTITYTTPALLNRWSHLAVTRNSTNNVVVYVNGTKISGATSHPGVFNITAIGFTSQGASWNGTLDDLLLFNRSLSSEQIYALWQNQTNIIVANETSRGENWTVQATPNDGSEDGEMSISNNITILNTPPTHSTPVLNTTNLSLNASFLQNLTLYPQSTADVDNDSVKNIINWLRSSIPIAVLNMPFEGINGTAYNNTWDYSENNNHGIEQGGAFVWNASGGYDNKGAYEFNGTHRFINITYNDTLKLGNTGSASLWFRPKDVGSGVRLLLNYCGNSYTNGYMIVQSSDDIALYWKSAGIIRQAINVLTPNTWNHVAVSNDNGSATLYVNGVNYSVASTGGAITANCSTFIGGQNVNWWFNGTIDEVMIFNRSLTSQQIYALFKNQTNIITANETRKDENWSAQVTPNDGQHDGIMLTSNNVTIFDRIAPSVTIVNPSNGSNFSARTQALNATVTDTESDISAVLFMFNTNATPFNATATNNSGTWGALVNLSVFPQGLHSAIVFANDTENNINQTVNISFTVDLTSPNITINYNFVDNSNFSIRSYNKTFNASVFDNVTRVDTVYFWFNNGTGTDFNITGVNNSGQWSVSYNVSSLAEGKQGAVVVANDTVNNVNNTQFINFTVDFSAPNVTFNYNFGDYSNFSALSSNKTFNATVTDALTDVSTVYFWFDNGTGQDFNVTAVNQSGNWIVSYNVSALAEERQGARIVANDSVNNINDTQFINFTIDRTVPTVNITSPSSGSTIIGTQQFNATITDNLLEISAAIFQISDGTTAINRTASNSSGTWNASFDSTLLTDGAITFIVFANDTVGNANTTQTISVTADNVAETATPNAGGGGGGGGSSSGAKKTIIEYVCGNGILENGEQCDSGEGCDDSCECQEGYEDADSIDCSRIPYCGDGIVNQPEEDCDVSDLAGESCITLGQGSGKLSCTSACTFDQSGCVEEQGAAGMVEPPTEKIGLIAKTKSYLHTPYTSSVNIIRYTARVGQLAVSVVTSLAASFREYTLYWLLAIIVIAVTIGIVALEYSGLTWKIKPEPKVQIEQPLAKAKPEYIAQTRVPELRSFGTRRYVDLHQELKRVETLLKDTPLPEQKNKALKLTSLKERTIPAKKVEKTKHNLDEIEEWAAKMSTFRTSLHKIPTILKNTTSLSEAEIKLVVERIRTTQLLEKKYDVNPRIITELKEFIALEKKKGASMEEIIVDLVREGWDEKVIQQYVKAWYDTV